MDIVSAALSLYLLFPILNERQQRYSELINKNLTSSPQEVEKRLELVRFLSLEEGDYSKAEELVLPEPEPAENGAENSSEKKETLVEVYLRDKERHLKLYQAGEEKFAVGNKDGLRSSVVSVNKDIFSRSKFDSSYRIIEKIEWKNSSSFADAIMVNKKNWFYKDNTIYMTEDDFIANTFSDSVLNEKLLPVKVSVYSLTEEESEKKEENNKEETTKEEKVRKKNLSEIDYYSYDEQNRISYEKQEHYEQRKNETTLRQKDVLVYVAEKKYIYREGFDNPDIKFYEDGKLRSRVEYTDENSYYEYLYFPGGAEVRSKYEDGTKTEEKIIFSGENS